MIVCLLCFFTLCQSTEIFYLYHFQKLNFDEIYDLVKEAKIKCSKSRLTDFLDEQVSIYFIFAV